MQNVFSNLGEANPEAIAIGRAGSEHVQKPADGVGWHTQRMRLIAEAIAAADVAENLSRDIQEKHVAHHLELERARV